MTLFALFAAPTAGPSTVIYLITSRNASFYWDSIECIERNGIIANYIVKLQDQENGTGIPGDLLDRNFTASGLTPGTHYTFQVAGVNINGLGPYSNTTFIKTDEESMTISLNGYNL